MKQTSWTWQDGAVDPTKEHIELRYGSAVNSGWDSWTRVARIGKPTKQVFPVEWLLDKGPTKNPKIINETVGELNFYLIELGKADPWAYAIYHCGTAANIYSNIHWSYFAGVSKHE